MIRSDFDIEPFTFRDMRPPRAARRRPRRRPRPGLYEFETLELESSAGMPTLRLGSRGSAVIDLQTRLATAGFSPGAADGIFGSRTDAAVRSFQRARGLGADGVVGPLTWGELLGTTTPQPAPSTGSPAPAPGSGTFPAAWSNGPVNPPALHRSVLSHSSIQCGSTAIPTGLQPESVSQGWTARTQKVASIISGPLFNWRNVNGRAERPTSRAPSSNHYCGRAIDAFPPGVLYGTVATGNGLREGWRLANWAAHNAQAHNVSEVIFFDRIWTVARTAEGWRPYTNPMGSGNSLQHRDHVHISVY
jgi:peptidoglycan hydrolase-like protein with peptidoglycan-binding domain